ncbi:MAG: M14 family metallopeptidase [Planctomycetota bacterium]
MAQPKTLLAVFLALATTASAQTSKPQLSQPLTVAEASGYAKTSRSADVVAFLHKLEKLQHANRLRRLACGRSTEGRELPLVIVSEPPLADDDAVMKSNSLRLLVIGNIHAGEVEGKEAVQILLRELANGKHTDLLEHAVLLFLPIYNPDGNDKISTRNRRGQNGPVGGVGRRPNGQGFDLNRDFIKGEAPETKALYGIWNRYDPHVFIDLHATNGSAHGYHLTYSPSLAANVDEGLRQFTRETFLKGIRAATKEKHGFRLYDYGTFARRRTAWRTYDHRPRFGTNCFGLRNRIAVLSEAFSYISFEQRIKVTRAFVLETLRAAVARRDDIKKLCAAADARMQKDGVRFGYDTELEEPWEDAILVGSVTRERVEGGTYRNVAGDKFEPKKMQVQIAFVAKKSIALPQAWAIRSASEKVLAALQAHGVRFWKLEEPRRVIAEVFQPTSVRKSRRVFQKHYEVRIQGSYQKQEIELGAGTVWVPARQRLGRLAAQALEAVSEDSLATWNYFDGQLQEIEYGSYPAYPVVRVLGVR